jgi:hypothetical protein
MAMNDHPIDFEMNTAMEQTLGEIYGGKKVSLLFQLNHLFRTNQP